MAGPVPDRTALFCAALRGLHHLRDAEPKILRDEYALALAGLDEAQAVEIEQNLLALGGSTSLAATRQRFSEDRVADAAARGVRQYVILGAGLDSFALRNADNLPSLAVYEVDRPGMQAWKRERLADLSIAVPTTLRFVPCDFEATDLPTALDSSDFDPGAPTIVSWLGVTQYLTLGAIRDTLVWFATLRTGSELVTTFVPPSEQADRLREVGQSLAIRIESIIEASEFADVVAAAGLVAEIVTPAELDHRYYRGRSDSMRAPRLEWLAVAHH